VIVPYRNRPEQLKVFKEYISNYLYSKGIHHEVIVVEQKDDTPFNRGLLLNWGCRKAEWTDCDYVVFHDIDMLPVDVDYSYTDNPVHLVENLEIPEEEDSLFYDYFGGVTMFNLRDIKRVNGFSNNYIGWGFEDDDLFLRCQEKGVKTDFMEWGQRRHAGIGLELNGKDSYIAVRNPIKSNRNFTLHGSFTIDNMDVNIDAEFDEMSIFSFPGNDISLSYRSFMNFSFQIWDSYLNPFSIYTKKYPFGSYNYCVVFDVEEENKKISLYINGNLVGEKTLDSLHKINQNYLYLGAGNPDRKDKPNFFKGIISNFAIYNKALTPKDIAEISNNTRFSLLEYESRKNLILYYDSKFITDTQFVDLVGKSKSIIKNCKKVYITEQERKRIPVPFRRPGRFKAIPHSNNGFDDTWNDWSSRTNQYKYFKLIENKKTNLRKDGIDKYWGELVEEFSDFNKHHMYVTT
tara:strand:- start:3462 stop:4844 length:1383 start_codon:yes stop_codon:yes gene_type:complete